MLNYQYYVRVYVCIYIIYIYIVEVVCDEIQCDVKQ